MNNLKKEIKFKSWHRGSKEMDFILGTFSENYSKNSSKNETVALRDLLESSDSDIHDWLWGHAKSPKKYSEIINELRDHLEINLPTKKVAAFSLIETAIVLLIIGVFIGGLTKGKDLFDSAKASAVIQNMQYYKLSNEMYRGNYRHIAGDDPHASGHFGKSAKNGNGNGRIDSNESHLFWQHLYLAGMIDSPTPPTTKFGGSVVVMYENTPHFRGNCLAIAQLENGKLNAILTPKQAQLIKSKGDPDNMKPQEGEIIIKDGADVPPGSCITAEGKLNMREKSVACIIISPLKR